MPSLMLFDLDGTLLDDSGLPAAMRTTCEVLAAGLPGVTADALVAANTDAWKRIWPDFEAAYMLGGDSGDGVGREAWRETLAACGVRDPAAVDQAEEVWGRHERASFRLFADAPTALDAFADARIRIGMVTNGNARVQREKLATVGIIDRFDPLVISSEVGFAKPDPAIFEVALAASGVAAAHTWFVGDNLWHDILGAQSAGIRSVWLDRRGVPPQSDWPRPDVRVRSLAELCGSAEIG